MNFFKQLFSQLFSFEKVYLKDDPKPFIIAFLAMKLGYSAKELAKIFNDPAKKLNFKENGESLMNYWNESVTIRQELRKNVISPPIQGTEIIKPISREKLSLEQFKFIKIILPELRKEINEFCSEDMTAEQLEKIKGKSPFIYFLNYFLDYLEKKYTKVGKRRLKNKKSR